MSGGRLLTVGGLPRHREAANADSTTIAALTAMNTRGVGLDQPGAVVRSPAIAARVATPSAAPTS